MLDVNFFSALLGGVLTFLAPCTFPLIPAYIGFLGGGAGAHASGLQVNMQKIRARVLMNALLFILGFSLVFIIFGLVSGVIGKFLILHRAFVAQLGGVLIIFFGIAMLDIFPLPNVFTGRTLPAALHPGNPFSAFLLGLLFALGWSPCLGPILGTILVLAGASGTALYGAWLLFVYALGLAIPFFLVAFLYGSAFTYVAALGRYLPYITKVAGIFFIAIGILLVTNQFGMMNVWATELLGNWYMNLVQFM